MPSFRYHAVIAKQSPHHQVMCFPAYPCEILQFSEIDRVGRDTDGVLRGFQRPQIAAHIHDIRDYLERDDAVLPNPLVIAFTSGIVTTERSDGTVDICIEVGDDKPG